MDSLITSAIALAAGGWGNVKLVRAFFSMAVSYPLNVGEWKLGIVEYTEVGPGDANIMRGHILVPGMVLTLPGQSSLHVTFGSPTIGATFSSGGPRYTAVLFTWD